MRRNEIKLSLVYRDMWQSAGKYVPRKDQLAQIAPAIVDMGCFHRVETNGGGFEQVNLLFGENPNDAVRAFTKEFNKAGIQTHMLERGLNGIRLSPVSKDLRKLMFAVKKKQGTDISRSFDGLNNPQNLAHSFQYAKDGGMIAQGALSITYSPIHTVEYYINLADQYIELGAQEICIKDMAGIGRPVSIGKMVKGIRERHPNIIIQYHGHSTPGLSLTSSLEAARNGADYIDVGMEPLSWGTGHADLLAVHAMLTDAGFQVAPINMNAYMEARRLSQSFIDDFLGYFINPRNRYMNSLLLGSGLPGGMMGSLMSDLENSLKSLNKYMSKRGKDEVSQDQLLIALFNEVEYIWPKMGYPPLVTPFSQYVKNVALVNVLQMMKGKDRWTLIDENTWGMLLGKSGKLPGSIDQKLVELAKSQGREFFTGNPQDLYPDVLDEYRKQMKEKGWETGQDDEELMEFAMHPRQYEEFKSGKAKIDFQQTLQAKIDFVQSHQNESKTLIPHVHPETNALTANPKNLTINVDGQDYKVKIKYDDDSNTNQTSSDNQITQVPTSQTTPPTNISNGKNDIEILAPLEGKFFLTRDASEQAIKLGDKVEVGQTVGYIEALKVINAITAEKGGVVTQIIANHGEDIEEDDVIIKLS